MSEQRELLLRNPYDFANPVIARGLFVGRDEEMREISYYIDFAKDAGRPINLALIGPRAAGKTSFLNATQVLAEERGFLAVRVNLDENDGKSQMAFFHKLLDSTLTTACRCGAFGGLSGKTYETYVDLTNTYSIPEDKEFCPFIFPMHYAKAAGHGNWYGMVSDAAFRNDMEFIQAETQKPIVLLIDECNVLAGSRVHLEKLRNTFMNMTGYMLVITGTDDLFPVIDDVFSPIVRQFKKIRVSGFKKIEQTELCVTRPLESLGLVATEYIDYDDIKEIHEISGGRPYEIQLICHILFRRVQAAKASRMELSLSVLEDVRRELENAQDMTIRTVIKKIISLQRRDLLALGFLCHCDSGATLEQLWAIEYAFNGESSWTRKALADGLYRLQQAGLVSVDNAGTIKFLGDEFDRTYLKYYLTEKGIDSGFRCQSLQELWLTSLDEFVSGHVKTFQSLHLPNDVDGEEIVAQLASENLKADIFRDRGPAVFGFYTMMIECRSLQQIRAIEIRPMVDWLRVKTWCYPATEDSLLEQLRLAGERLGELGYQAVIRAIDISVVPWRLLVDGLLRSENQAIRRSLAEYHVLQMIARYRSSIEEALFHCQVSLILEPDPPAVRANNLAYVLIRSDSAAEQARLLLDKAILDERMKALATYNMGILEAKCGRLANALRHIEDCIEWCSNIKSERVCLCLMYPITEEGHLTISERFDCDLLQVATEARDAIRALTPVEPD